MHARTLCINVLFAIMVSDVSMSVCSIATLALALRALWEQYVHRYLKILAGVRHW